MRTARIWATAVLLVLAAGRAQGDGLESLRNIRMVIHNGRIIRGG